MSLGEEPMEEPKGGEPDETRRPYEKPAVAWEERLDERPGLIAACGKVVNAQAGCEAIQAS